MEFDRKFCYTRLSKYTNLELLERREGPKSKKKIWFSFEGTINTKAVMGYVIYFFYFCFLCRILSIRYIAIIDTIIKSVKNILVLFIYWRFSYIAIFYFVSIFMFAFYFLIFIAVKIYKYTESQFEKYPPKMSPFQYINKHMNRTDRSIFQGGQIKCLFITLMVHPPRRGRCYP